MMTKRREAQINNKADSLLTLKERKTTKYCAYLYKNRIKTAKNIRKY